MKLLPSLSLIAILAAGSLQAQSTYSVRVNSSTDDAEEEVGSGAMYTTSSDLEMSFDSFVTDDQLVGIRFSTVSLPANATIVNAYIQFQVDELKANDPCNLTVFVEDNINPSTYTTTTGNISGRTYINDSVQWNPATWVAVGDQGPAQRTPNLKSLVDSITSKSTWVNGNPMAFMIKGSGTRTAEAHDGTSSAAPMLVIEYGLPGQFLLQVLHASDLEGGVTAIEDAPAFAAIVDKLEDEYANSITISSGDNYIPGPFMSAADASSVEDSLNAILSDFYGVSLTTLGASAGRVDIATMNVIGFDASAIGNHEFDLGESRVALAAGGEEFGGDLLWMGAQFPYLSANLDFSSSLLNTFYVPGIQNANNFVVDVTNPASATTTPKLAPATIITVNGENIGVVGATTQMLSTITSAGNVSVVGNPTMNDMTQLAGVIQPYIDSLTSQGINKIIVASHLQQFSLEQALAGLLNDVDIILAGGSDFLLADNTDVLRAGDVADGNYPYQTVNAQGDSVLIVSTDGEYSYVGRLVVAFDANGHLLPSSVNPSVSGAYATLPTVVNQLWGSQDPYATGTKGNFVERLTGSVIDVVVAKDSVTFGKSEVFLEGRRAFVRTEETNMGNLSADANLWVAQQYDATVAVSLKNGGGIRSEIGVIDQANSRLLPPQANPVAGKDSLEVSQLDIENTLRFNNGLKVVETTPSGLRDLLEHGISNWDGVSTNGQMPQVGGMRFSFDPTAAVGSKIQNMAIIDENGNVVDSIVVNGSLHGDQSRVIKLVSLNFLVDNDGDGYPFSTVTTNGVDLDANNTTLNGVASFAVVGSEQNALAEYLAQFHTVASYAEAETTPSLDRRIQILSERADSVFTFGINVQEYAIAQGLTVYPNPADAFVMVKSEFSNLQTIDIIHLTGHHISKVEATGAEIKLDLSSLNTGLYILLIQTEAGMTTSKLLID